MEISSLKNMAYGFQSVLKLEGKTIALDHCSYAFAREINEKTGEVESGVSGGTVTVNYIDFPSNVILEWGMKYKLKDCSVKLRKTDSNEGTYTPEEEVKLCNAACVALDINYSRHGTAHFNTQLTITADESTVGSGESVVKKWKLI
jgi:hypothetical protein